MKLKPTTPIKVSINKFPFDITVQQAIAGLGFIEEFDNAVREAVAYLEKSVRKEPVTVSIGGTFSSYQIHIDLI